MKLEMTVFSVDAVREENWTNQIRSALQNWVDVDVRAGSKSNQLGQVIFVDGTELGSGFVRSQKIIDEMFLKTDRRGKVLFLVVDEAIKDFPAPLLERKVDDVIVHPFRPLELLSKIQNYEQALLWAEMSQLNASFSEVLGHLQGDLELAERLQRAKLPKRFGDVKGLNIAQRYLVGSRSGGDYFDLAETKDRSSLSLVLSNASSYGLSNSVLSVLMRVCLKVTVDQLQSSGATIEVVKKIHDDLLLTLGEKEFFSIFFGTFSRRDSLLRFTFLGEGALYCANPSQSFEYYPPMGQVISKASEFPDLGELQVQLQPMGRLILCSGGALELLGGTERVSKLLGTYREKYLDEILNELVFQIKSNLTDDEMPGRDCTVLALEILNQGSPRVVELFKPEQDES
jgi:sigma-B regulation protein RsbU (phosphoserine phosphatase)